MIRFVWKLQQLQLHKKIYSISKVNLTQKLKITVKLCLKKTIGQIEK